MILHLSQGWRVQDPHQEFHCKENLQLNFKRMRLTDVEVSGSALEPVRNADCRLGCTSPEFGMLEKIALCHELCTAFVDVESAEKLN